MPGATKFGLEFLINTTTTNNQSDPDVTALADGRFLVVWDDESASGGDTSLTAVRGQIFNADGTKSGSEFLVNTTTTDDQELPAVTALAGGRFVVAWEDESLTGGDTSNDAVRAQIFNADGSKSGLELLVNTTTVTRQGDPTITTLADGRFVIAWEDGSQSGGDTSLIAIRAQIFNPDGSKSGLELLVNTTTTNDQSDASITALADGQFVVAWEDASLSGGDTSGKAVRAQIFNSNGSKSGLELLVNTATTDNQEDAAVTALADGRFVVAWQDDSASGGDTSGTAVRAQIFNANGSKSGTEFLVNTVTTNNQLDPDIAALPDGRFVVVYQDLSLSGGDTSVFAVRGQVFNGDGSKSGAEFLVNTTTSQDQLDPTVTVLADGQFVVTWEDESASGGDASLDAVRGQIFDPREEALILSGTTLGEDFVGTGFDDFIDARGGNDRINGAAGNDTLLGGAGTDTVIGDSGNDTLDGGLGTDLLVGGTGDDKYVLANGTDTVTDTGGTDTVTSTITRSIASLGTIENLTLLGAAAINGTGNGLNNTIIGNAAANILQGGVGNDILDGGLGNDTLNGGLGNDTFVINSTSDILQDSGGVDLVQSTVSKTLAAGFENLTLLGTAAINGVGNAVVNIITGNTGANVLNGLTGNDRLIGGGGNDNYVIDSAGDVLIDSSGIDTVLSTVNKRLATGFENLTLLGSAGLEGIGNAAANVINGNGGNNRLFGLDGGDTINGGSGLDKLTGGLGKDVLAGGAGADDFDYNTIAELGTGATRDVIKDFTAGDDIDLSTIDGNGTAVGNAFTFLSGEGAAFTGVAGQLRFRHLDAANPANDITIVEGDINGNRVADFQLQVNGLKNLIATDFIL